MDIKTFIKAQDRLDKWIVYTPLITDDVLNEKWGRKVYFKCENFQITGSFKIRGCLHSMLSGDKEPRITRSSGNFAQAMAWSGRQLGIPVTVVMPENAPRVKVERARALGAEVILCGTTHVEGEAKVDEIIHQSRKRYTSPYNDEDVIIGQGSLALEVFNDLPTVKHFLCPVGGGGLLSGCSAALKLQNSSIDVIAVEPEGANDFYLSKQQGKLIRIDQIATIADGLRAPIVGEVNWPILQRHVDRVFLVSDRQIIEAMQLLLETVGIVAEPSGVVSVAAALANLDSLDKGDIVCVISGGNVDRDKFLEWVRSPFYH